MIGGGFWESWGKADEQSWGKADERAVLGVPHLGTHLQKKGEKPYWLPGEPGP